MALPQSLPLAPAGAPLVSPPPVDAPAGAGHGGSAAAASQAACCVHGGPSSADPETYDDTVGISPGSPGPWEASDDMLIDREAAVHVHASGGSGGAGGGSSAGPDHSHPEPAQIRLLRDFLESTFDAADQLQVVNADKVVCQLCTSHLPVNASLTAASNPGIITRSSIKDNFFDAIKRHVAGSKHAGCRSQSRGAVGAGGKAARLQQQSLSDMFSRAAPLVRPELVLAPCCGYKALSVTITLDGESVTMDPRVLLDDPHDGLDKDGQLVWWADRRKECFRGR